MDSKANENPHGEAGTGPESEEHLQAQQSNEKQPNNRAHKENNQDGHCEDDNNSELGREMVIKNELQSCDEGLRINHKYFSLITGNPLNHDVNIERNLVEIMPNLQRMNNLEESDIILHFCFVESRAGTDIGAAGKMLSALAGKKRAVLMVLHSRRDPKDFKPDRVVTRQNMITVDCLFCEDQGLLQCTENDEALATILTWLSSEERLKRTPKKGPTDNFSFHRPMKPSLNYFTLISGKALGQDLKIERKLQEQNPDLRKVQNLEESDLILVFCPVVSRAGTDIEAAVKMINTKAGHKAAVLLVLHHTFDPHHIVPDSKRAVNREKTIAVDCLFHEDQGFLTCSQNQDALSQVGKWLRVCKK